MGRGRKEVVVKGLWGLIGLGFLFGFLTQLNHCGEEMDFSLEITIWETKSLYRVKHVWQG